MFGLCVGLCTCGGVCVFGYVCGGVCVCVCCECVCVCMCVCGGGGGGGGGGRFMCMQFILIHFQCFYNNTDITGPLPFADSAVQGRRLLPNYCAHECRHYGTDCCKLINVLDTWIPRILTLTFFNQISFQSTENLSSFAIHQIEKSDIFVSLLKSDTDV